MSKQLKQERCWHCDDPTGRAGRADDSLYDGLENGPYCPDCWNTLCEAVEEDYAEMQAIVDKLLVADRMIGEAVVVKRHGMTKQANKLICDGVKIIRTAAEAARADR